MIAKNLIANNIPPLKTSDTGEKALQWMGDFYVAQLPVVEGEQFVGVIGEDDILDFNRPELPIKQHPLSLHRPFVYYNEHIYEVIKKMVNLQLTILPVLEEGEVYMGLITQESLLNYFAETASLQHPGAILVIEIGNRDFAMSEIARIVESEGALVMSAFVTSQMNALRVEVTLKINKQNLGGIISTFERYGYEVKASFLEYEYAQNLKERYDSFMSYMNV